MSRDLERAEPDSQLEEPAPELVGRTLEWARNLQRAHVHEREPESPASLQASARAAFAAVHWKRWARKRRNSMLRWLRPGLEELSWVVGMELAWASAALGGARLSSYLEYDVVDCLLRLAWPLLRLGGSGNIASWTLALALRTLPARGLVAMSLANLLGIWATQRALLHAHPAVAGYLGLPPVRASWRWLPSATEPLEAPSGEIPSSLASGTVARSQG